MNRSDAWDRVRSTLVRPPAYARKDEQRRTTYQAAMVQCEELVNAAAASAPSASPLPLFYALNQAGRALAAAAAGEPNGGEWRLKAHGIAQGTGDVREAMSMTIRPTCPRRRGNAFAIVADTIGSSQLSAPVTLQELYTALPDLEAKPVPDSCTSPRALYVEEYDDEAAQLSGRLPVVRATVVSPGRPLECSDAFLDRYPSLHEATPTWQHHTKRGIGCLLEWWLRWGTEEEWRLLDDAAPAYRFSGERWAIPTVGEGRDHLSPLMLWWALLFGYSVLARYEPAAWTKAIDLRTEPWAAAIIASLDEAFSALPELIWIELERLDDL